MWTSPSRKALNAHPPLSICTVLALLLCAGHPGVVFANTDTGNIAVQLRVLPRLVVAVNRVERRPGVEGALEVCLQTPARPHPQLTVLEMPEGAGPQLNMQPSARCAGRDQTAVRVAVDHAKSGAIVVLVSSD